MSHLPVHQVPADLHIEGLYRVLMLQQGREKNDPWFDVTGPSGRDPLDVLAAYVLAIRETHRPGLALVQIEDPAFVWQAAVLVSHAPSDPIHLLAVLERMDRQHGQDAMEELALGLQALASGRSIDIAHAHARFDMWLAEAERVGLNPGLM